MVHTDGFVDWFDDVLQLLRKDFPKRSIFPSQTKNQKNQSTRPIQRRSFCFQPMFFHEENMWCATLSYFLSLQPISHDERLKSDAWHGNALLSCGPHKLVPQQKLSEFNGELVACLKVSTFGVFLELFNWKWFRGFRVTSKMVWVKLWKSSKVSVSFQGWSVKYDFEFQDANWFTMIFKSAWSLLSKSHHSGFFDVLFWHIETTWKRIIFGVSNWKKWRNQPLQCLLVKQPFYPTSDLVFFQRWPGRTPDGMFLKDIVCQSAVATKTNPLSKKTMDMLTSRNYDIWCT